MRIDTIVQWVHSAHCAAVSVVPYTLQAKMSISGRRGQGKSEAGGSLTHCALKRLGVRKERCWLFLIFHTHSCGHFVTSISQWKDCPKKMYNLMLSPLICHTTYLVHNQCICCNTKMPIELTFKLTASEVRASLSKLFLNLDTHEVNLHLFPWNSLLYSADG